MSLWLPVQHIWLPVLAFLLDMLLGDPAAWPHPVRWLGRFMSALQKPLLGARHCRRAVGVLILCGLLAVAGALVLLVINLPAVGLPWWIGALAAVYFSYAGLALGCLLREGAKTAELIQNGSLEEGRHAVSMLVSRDVSALERPAMFRTLAESLSENFTDAFVAPLFWLMLGGPVGLWLYKSASTADSMWGYKHEPWRLPGWASARLDDVLAFVPARLAAFCLYATRLGRLDSWPGWGPVLRQAGSMESPNAGWSMSTAAWLHGAPMGGPAVYAGKLKQKPLLGPEHGAWDFRTIHSLLGHLRTSGFLCFFVLWGFMVATSFAFGIH